MDLKICVTSGLANARKVMEQVKNGEKEEAKAESSGTGLITTDYTWSSSNMKTTSTIDIAKKDKTKLQSIGNLVIRDIDKIAITKAEGDLWENKPSQTIIVTFNTELREGEIKEISIKNTKDASMYTTTNDCTLSSQTVQCNIDLLNITHGTYSVIFVNTCQKVYPPVEIKVHTDSICDPPLVIHEHQCKSCSDINPDFPLYFNKTCVAECTGGYKYKYKNSCYEKCGEGDVPPKVQNNECVNQCTGEYGTYKDNIDTCVLCKNYADLPVANQGKCQCEYGLILNEKNECVLPEEEKKENKCAGYCLNGGKCYLIGEMPKCNCTLTSYSGVVCNVKKEDIATDFKKELDVVVNNFSFSDNSTLQKVKTLSNIIMEKNEDVQTIIDSNLDKILDVASKLLF